MATMMPPPTDMQEDDERFCSTCFAGMTSSEHHEKCVAPLDQLDDRPGGAA